jgi:hypothetical protein
MGKLIRLLPSEDERLAMQSEIESIMRVVGTEAIECPECKAVALVQVWSCGCQYTSYQVGHVYRPKAKFNPTVQPSTCERFDFTRLDRRCVLHISHDDYRTADTMPSPRDNWVDRSSSTSTASE